MVSKCHLGVPLSWCLFFESQPVTAGQACLGAGPFQLIVNVKSSTRIADEFSEPTTFRLPFKTLEKLLLNCPYMGGSEVWINHQNINAPIFNVSLPNSLPTANRFGFATKSEHNIRLRPPRRNARGLVYQRSDMTKSVHFVVRARDQKIGAAKTKARAGDQASFKAHEPESVQERIRTVRNSKIREWNPRKKIPRSSDE